MRKIGIFLALLAFLLFLILGFQVAKLFASPGDAQSGNFPSQEQLAQSNILLVHVDQMNQEEPRLISLWAVFSYQADPASLSFLPIFPTGNSNDQNLAAKFRLMDENKVPDSFLEQLQEEYNIHWDHMVLIDQEGANYWSQFLTGQPYSQSLETDNQALLQPEITLISTFCVAVRERGSGLLTGLEWNQVIPDHMRTDLPFDSVISEWDRIQKSGLCDVFAK